MSNVAVDMISACLSHYKRYNRKVEIVYLNKRYWELFLRYIGEQLPEKYNDAKATEAMEFRNLMIKRGSRFQHERLIPEFKKEVANA